MSDPDHKKLDVEYQAAQASAEHHDQLAWTLYSILWGASLVLLGFALSSSDDLKFPLLLTVVALLGVILIICVWVAAADLNSIKRQKYKRCKALEPDLGFEQHSKLVYTGRISTITAVINVLIIVTWLAVVGYAWWSYCR